MTTNIGPLLVPRLPNLGTPHRQNSCRWSRLAVPPFVGMTPSTRHSPRKEGKSRTPEARSRPTKILGIFLKQRRHRTFTLVNFTALFLAITPAGPRERHCVPIGAKQMDRRTGPPPTPENLFRVITWPIVPVLAFIDSLQEETNFPPHLSRLGRQRKEATACLLFRLTINVLFLIKVAAPPLPLTYPPALLLGILISANGQSPSLPVLMANALVALFVQQVLTPPT